MSEQARFAATFHRVRELIEKSEGIAPPLKKEALGILEAIDRPEGQPARNLVECFGFLSMLLRSARYKVDEFMLTIECLELLDEAEALASAQM